MGLSSKSTQEAFIGSPRVRAGSLAAACLLLIASLFGVWRVFSLPVETEEPIALVNYEHCGEFDYLVYLKPNSLYGPPPPKEEEETEEEAPLVFFRDIIDDVDLAFSYKFDLSEPMASITNEVVVTITAESPGKWQKEISVLEERHRGRDFRVAFPLRLESLEDVVDDIEEDIGVTTTTRQFIIKAVVHTTAETREGEIIEDDFSHEITAILKEKTLELEGDLEADYTALFEERISYRGEGRFDYEVYLERNKLYEETVLRSESLPVAPLAPTPRPAPPPTLQTLGPGLTYFPRIIDKIEASFSYRFNCDRPVKNLVEEVEVTALLEDALGRWSKTFTLVPKTRKSGPFVVDFPVDVSKLNEVTDILRGELGFGAASYDLTIEAVVHTSGDTDFEPIDEVFTHSLEGKLGGTTLTWTGELDKKEPGTIEGSKLVPAPNVSRFRPLSLLIVAVAVFGLFFVLWNTYRVRALGMRLMEVEALRAKRKHKNVVVDVTELPPARAGEVVIPVGSVDELVRTADALLKPVLHQAEADKHTYCVIDGAIRYQYISQP